VTEDEIFLKFSADKLEQFQGRIQDCLARLTSDQIWTRHSENENAVGNLVLHLSGNIRQWIGSGVAGLPDNRQRDVEFDARGGQAPAELAELLRTRVAEAVGIIREMPAARLTERITPQGHDVTVLEAIAHVVEHFFDAYRADHFSHEDADRRRSGLLPASSRLRASSRR